MLHGLVGPQIAAAMTLCRRRLDVAQAPAAGLVLEATSDVARCWRPRQLSCLRLPATAAGLLTAGPSALIFV